AEAIAAGDKINKCPPGGEATIRALADLLDLEPEPLDATEETPPRVAYIREAECIGCTKCIQACPVDAIVGAARLMHTVIADECTGCDLCLEPCPVDCIEMREIPDDVRHWKWPQPSPRLIASDRERAA
ncbi:RnfABCDGE type electron transport complex subunit B, partial [Pseudomonas aeruginosa]